MNEICDCQQCKELRRYERIREYFSNPANCLSLHPQEMEMRFRISKIRKDSIADYLINKYLVVCNDGFIRRR